jgi:hypothetical protein
VDRPSLACGVTLKVPNDDRSNSGLVAHPCCLRFSAPLVDRRRPRTVLEAAGLSE